MEKEKSLAVHCAFDKMVAIEEVKSNPLNPNTHPAKQITLLAKIIEAQGWRVPITISKLTGCVVRGHGRLMAAKKLRVSEVPVDFQDYDTEELEFADLVADNQIAELAELDYGVLKGILQEIDFDTFDMDLIGFPEIELAGLLENNTVLDPEEEWRGMPEFTKDDTTAFRSIIVHFKDQEKVDEFIERTGMKISDKSKYAWYPEIEIADVADMRYVDES